MTSAPVRGIALGVAAASVLATVATMSPALADSPGNTVSCTSPQVDADRGVLTEFTLQCTDADGAPVDSYVAVRQPGKAQTFQLDAATGAVSYTSVAGANGTDSFTFKGVVAGLGESPVTTATITFANERPTCDEPEAVTVVHDRSVVVPLVCEDADGDPLTRTVGTSAPAHGSVVVTGSRIVYTPASHYVGADGFTLRAGDGSALSEEVAVEVAVTNDAPECTGGRLSTVHDRAKAVDLSCSDADDDDLTGTVVTAAQHGTVRFRNGKMVYDPADGYVGSDVFTVRASDGVASSPAVRFRVAVTNALPTCSMPDRLLKVRAGGSAPVRVSCSDPDRDAVELVVVDAPNHGRLVRRANGFGYTPDKGYRGRDSFRIAGTDGVATSDDDVRVVKVVRAGR